MVKYGLHDVVRRVLYIPMFIMAAPLLLLCIYSFSGSNAVKEYKDLIRELWRGY